MSLSTTIQDVQKPTSPQTTVPSHNAADAVLSMVLLSVYGAQMSRKTVRKLKRRFFFTALKLKAQSFFGKRREISDRTLIYIIAGIAFLALLFISPITALVLALVILILILAGVI